MRKMAVIIAFATATALALTSPALASSRHHRTHHHGVRSDGPCPFNLGCGCNLANYFHVAGKAWRDLWVARNWAHYGSPAHKGCTGCVAVLTRGRGGHVGVVKSYDANGNPVIHSYANGRLGWTTTSYSARRVIAYRWVGEHYAASATAGPTF